MDIAQRRLFRRHFSRLAMAVFWYQAMTVGAQYLLAAVCGALRPDLLTKSWFLTLSVILSTYLVGFPVLLCLLPKPPRETPEGRVMGFKPFLIALLMSLGLLYPLNLLGNAVNSLLGALLRSHIGNPVLSLVEDNSVWLLFVCVCVIAPIMEELVFRKMLIDRIAPIDKRTAVLFSALVFGLFHGNFAQFFYAFALGLFWGFLYVKTGRLRYSIGLHMLVNTLGSVVTSLLMRDMDLDALLADGAEAVAGLFQAIPGLLALALYMLALISASIAGVCLLISRRRQFRIGESGRLPRGEVFRTVYLTPGFLCLFLISVSLFALSIF